MAKVSECPYEVWLEAIQREAARERDDDGYITIAELRDRVAPEHGLDWMRRVVAALLREGLIESGTVWRRAISGRRCMVPAYRLTAKAVGRLKQENANGRRRDGVRNRKQAVVR